MKRFAPLFLLMFALLLVGRTDAARSKYAPAFQEIYVDQYQRYTISPTQKTSVDTGYPLVMWGLDYAVAADTPEAMARQYLSENAKLLGLNSAELLDLKHSFTRDGLSGYVVRFDQYVGEIPVYKSEIAVHINNQNIVTYVANDYKPNIAQPNRVPLVSAASARNRVYDHLKVSGEIRHESSNLFVFHNAEGSRLAHEIVVIAAEPNGQWEALVDAHTGEIFSLTDGFLYIDGTGTTFDPDPITSSGGVYGDPSGIVDDNDATSADLEAQMVTVPLRDITFDGTNYMLTSPNAEIVDVEGPSTGLFAQPSSDFSSTRDNNLFEAVTVFYHVDDNMRYVNETLKLDITPYQYAGAAVRYDPHGQDGADNSRYSGAAGDIAFGEGCVDDGEDSDVIHHELAHGLHDWVTNGGLSNYVDGLSEGSGDYWAQSYNRRTSDLPPSHPYYNHVFRWDGHNECWDGRTTDYQGTPWPLIGGPLHTAGQIWSTCMMMVWDAIGAERADIIFWEGLGMTTTTSNQSDAANGVYQAARDLFYTDEELMAIHSILDDRLQLLNSRCGYILPPFTPGDTPPTTSVSIDDVTVGEGDGTATLTVSLTSTTDDDVTIDFATVASGSATGDDFVAASDTLTITAGMTTGTIDITITNDAVDEADESFDVQLSNPSENATITDNTGVVTITDNDDAPTISIADALVQEDAGNAQVVVTLSAESSFPISVTYTTQDGTATASDYTAVSGSVDFAAGETEKTIQLDITPDNVDENDETFSVELSDPSNATLDDGSATVTIQDINDAPTLSVADVTVDEGVGMATVTVTLSGGTELVPTVAYATSDGDALDGSDYAATSGTLTFDGSNSETFMVAITDDTDDENTELFNVTLSNPTDATIADGSAEIRINDNDEGTYEISISDVTVDEAAGTATVNVTLSTPANNGVTVDYATSDGTAAAGSDYTAIAPTTLTFANGEDTMPITVTISDDELDEAAETVLVTLSNAGGADNPTIADDQGIITITDDDDAPSVSVADVTVGEADGTASVEVTLSAASGKTVSVDYATSDGTAAAGSDYTAIATTKLTFAAGEMSKSFNITIKPDTLDEEDETLNVTLSNVSNATIGTGSATVTISDDDVAPMLSIADVSVDEAAGNATIEVLLNAASGKSITVNYATNEGSATADVDYTTSAGTLTFAPGVTAQTFDVPIASDTTDEIDESFAIVLSNAGNATFSNDTATVTINDDDAPPAISIGDVSAVEGDGTITFTVSIDAVSSLDVSADYATTADSAQPVVDYVSKSGTVTIAAGETSAEIVIALVDDTQAEATERFFVALGNAQNGAIDDFEGDGTILDDDSVPILVISDAMVDEGVMTATVTVTLSAESGQDVTVEYATADGARAGATAGEDYTATSGTLTIPAGQTMGIVSVAISDDDTANEGDETFSINFSNATNATLDPNNDSATVTISDNEVPTAVGLQAFGSTKTTLWWLPLLAVLLVVTTLMQRRRNEF